MHSLLLMHLGILNEAATLINVFSLTGGKNALIKWVWTKMSGLETVLVTLHFLYVWPNLNYRIV